MPTARETLVFVHGSGDSAQVWGPLIALLPGYACVALDLPGHGALVAEPGPTEMGVAEYATFVRAELARRGLTAPTVVGHSLGGAVALRLALDAPEVVGRLILVGSGARLRVALSYLEAARVDDPQGQAAITRVAFAEEHAAQADAWQAERQPAAPGMLYRDLAACDRFDVLAEVGRISAPTLLIVGAGDRMTPPKYSEYLRAQLPNSALAIIADAGHYAQLEQPRAVADAIRQFIG
ncbi:MAG TPA: alpha/beta hydrolase [Ktedonobacterales bacterium]